MTERKVEQYRAHELLAAEHQGSVVGRAWQNKKLVHELQGESIDDVLFRLKDWVDRALHAGAIANGPSLPVATIVRALQSIREDLGDGYRAMLRAHFHAPDQTMTATQLAEAAGYANFNAANLHYGNIGKMLYEVAPMMLRKRTDESLVYTSYLADAPDDQNDESHWRWKLRPEVAEALKQVGLDRWG